MMSDYIKKSEAGLLSEKERKIKKQKEDEEYFKWKKKREANGNVPLFENLEKSAVEMSAGISANSSNSKFEARLARELREDNERKKQDQVNEILNEFGYEKVTKEDPRTLICDGAYLHCSKGVVVTQTHLGIETQTTAPSGLINQMPTKIPMIELKATHSSTYLMGIDQVATFLDIDPENFEPLQNLFCMEGGKCEIKNNAVMWTDYSQNLKIDGAGALLKRTKLICGKCPLADIEFTDNGQAEEILGAPMEATLAPFGWTPTNKKILKSIIPVIAVIRGAVKIGVGVAIIVITEGVGTPYAMVLIGEGAATGFLGGRDLYQTWTGEDIIFNASKGFFSITGMKGEMLDSTSNLITTGIDTGLIIKDFYSMRKNIDSIVDTSNKNMKINEIIKNNSIIDGQIAGKQIDIKKLENKFGLTTGMQPAPAFTAFDKVKLANLRTDVVNLESQKNTVMKLGNYTKDVKEFSETGLGQISSTIVTNVNYNQSQEIDLDFEEFFYKSQLKYAKEPFTTKRPVVTRKN